MEAIDRSQWPSQDWAQPASSHYRNYQDPPPQRSWFPPPPQHTYSYHQTGHHHNNNSNNHHHHHHHHAQGSYSDYQGSSSNSTRDSYYSASTASTSPASQHLSPPTPQHQLLSNSETSNIMGFLDNFQNSYSVARGGDHWHHQQAQQSRHIPPHHHHHHQPHIQQPGGATVASTPSDYHPSSLCPPPQMPNRPVQGLYPKIEYPEAELDTKDHLYTYASPPPGSSYSSASGAPSPPSNLSSSLASRPSQAPSQRRRSHSSTSGSASPNSNPLSVLARGSLGATSPQKRMNHIMSEQRRRNAIREGYHTLIQLLAPEDGGPMIEMPTRGRPKGSSAKNRNRKRGKSGILFRAVEFTNWLEEGNSALRAEVAKMEAASGHG